MGVMGAAGFVTPDGRIIAAANLCKIANLGPAPRRVFSRSILPSRQNNFQEEPMATQAREVHVIEIDEPPEIEFDAQGSRATLHFLGTDLTAIFVSMPTALLRRLQADIAVALDHE
jgi:hypothetical protein